MMTSPKGVEYIMNQEEIKFWQKAQKLIREGYGKPCKEFNIHCAACLANLTYNWIQEHIELLRNNN